MLLDVVFSLDSVITAVGMANTLWVMATAIIIAVAIMLTASRPLAEFVQRHPTVKMLALSFLMLIGMTLIADGAGLHVPKGYIYAAIGFSVGVEGLNQFAARRRRPRGGVRPVSESGATRAQPLRWTASRFADEGLSSPKRRHRSPSECGALMHHGHGPWRDAIGPTRGTQ
jgi:hypothetical protein